MFVLSAGLFEFTPRFSFIEGFPDSAESKAGFETLKSAYPPGELAPTSVLISKDDENLLEHLQAIEDISASLDTLPVVDSVTSITRPLGKPLDVEISVIQPLAAQMSADPQQIGALMATLPPEQAQLAGAFLAGQRLISNDRSATTLEVVLNVDPYDTDAMDAIPKIRETVRKAVNESTLNGATALVGGESATNEDSRTVINRDFVVVAPIVVVAIWVILAILLGSVVAPTYLVLSVALSFAAALGASVIVFEIHLWTRRKLLRHHTVHLRFPHRTWRRLQHLHNVARSRRDAKTRTGRRHEVRDHSNWRRHHLRRHHPRRNVLRADHVPAPKPLPTRIHRHARHPDRHLHSPSHHGPGNRDAARRNQLVALQTSESTFQELKHLKFLPENEAYRDDTRKLLDQLRLKRYSEPSVHGGNKQILRALGVQNWPRQRLLHPQQHHARNNLTPRAASARASTAYESLAPSTLSSALDRSPTLGASANSA